MAAGINISTLSAAAERVGQSLVNPGTVRKQASAATGNAATTAATGTGSQITSSDFLTLLVTEMKNQDPTQPTDPNAYIQQLVGVNSLQQLIAINKDLSGSAGSAAAAATQPIPATTL